jgi:pimeloyl-ACP methyl ester carboxylesterase
MSEERTPLVLLHGFTGTAAAWGLVRPLLEERYELLVPTLAGHHGGPPLPAALDSEALVAPVVAAMDERGWATAHVVGNSLGGWVALQLAERGRARTVTALAPAGGWAAGDESWRDVLSFFVDMQQQVKAIAPQAAALAATPQGRRGATAAITVNWEHLTPEVVEELLVGVARCDGAPALIAHATEAGWPLDPARVTCPLRFVWGHEDRLLPWPSAAAGYRAAFPAAEWIELADIGHCPQLDVPLETAQLILGHAS